MTKIGAGDKLKFTGRFLKNTGQIVGGEGHTVFTVVEHDCRMCKSGLFVAVDQASTQEDENGNSIGPRHILASNLYRVGTLVVANAD